ncbi:UDP-glycosyltransferase 74G1 [Gossypium hirsutum]|uniref:UDP-glycosyltransferase 74G1 n=1 Tax=Gossypium hirsutum TaxID=3635 RepID=A0ABM3AD34_GOSHI|nr:UDP-glycosyltransferase 74G1-like [Gossypium hirsutum]
MSHFAKRLVSKGIKTTLVTSVFISNPSFPTHAPPPPPTSKPYPTASTKAALTRPLAPKFTFKRFSRWALDVAKQFGIPPAVFFTQSCAVNNVYYHVSKGILQLPLLPEVNVSLPELPLLQVSELPSFISDYEPQSAWFDVTVKQFENVDGADWVVFNIFYELEEVVDWMSSFWNVMTIGPTIPSMYLDKRLDDDKDYGMNLFNPETDACRSWLNGKPNGSVVYVSFGSLALPEANQMQELALALKGSDCNFLWVVRETTEMAKLPTHFIEETKEKGLVVTWYNQLEVLSHDLICCFLTHCGLNSVLEALSLGVLMLEMPFWTDQITNAKLVEDVYGALGLRVGEIRMI